MTETLSAKTVAAFEALLRLEFDCASAKTGEIYGVDYAARKRASADRTKIQAKMSDALDALSLDELKAYGEYRKQVR